MPGKGMSQVFEIEDFTIFCY